MTHLTIEENQTITVTIPLFIRLLELAREDIKNDVEIHEVTERAQNISGVLTMENYSYIAGENIGANKNENI